MTRLKKTKKKVARRKAKRKINGMATLTKKEMQVLRMKADLLDELMEAIEDNYLGELMREAEKGPTISLSQAKKLLK